MLVWSALAGLARAGGCPARTTETTHRLVLVGDAGDAQADDAILTAAAACADREAGDLVVLLGDNVYFGGHWPRPGGMASSEQGGAQLDAQLSAFADDDLRVVPGNHDAYSGRAELEAQRVRVGEARWFAGSRAGQAESPCATFWELERRGDLLLIGLDSMSAWRCSRAERDSGWARLGRAVADLEGPAPRWVVVAAHHPVRTRGPHAGTSLTGQDVGDRTYERQWIGRLETLSTTPSLKGAAWVLAAGHDHLLEALPDPNAVFPLQVVSGAGSALRYTSPRRFAKTLDRLLPGETVDPGPGFVVLDLGEVARATLVHPSPPPVVVAHPRRPAAAHDRLSRSELHRWAVREDLPLFWTEDRDADGELDPDEVVSLLFYPTAPEWTKDAAFTPAFEEAYARLVDAASTAPPTGLAPDEARRRSLVGQDLDQGRPTLVSTDLRGASPEELAFVDAMLEVARHIDDLYERQLGVAALGARLPGDAASASLFRRNRGPRCEAPLTREDPHCTALSGVPAPAVDVYPLELQAAEGWCAALEARPDAASLLSPFSVVRADGGELTTVPYTVAYAEQGESIARALERAADALDPAVEGALVAYLSAAAAAFRTGDWEGADEAWASMNAENSRWYVRVGPDETYWEPCGHKAGFHLTLARIDRASLAWQAKLTPLRQDLEAAVARAAGPPYAAREVSFHLPDFVQITINAGNDRSALGGTIGQSLPNWGPVAEEGRGRTIAMTNLFTDPDSVAVRRAQAASLLDADALRALSDDPGPGLLDTLLHEATHNLGPAQGYTVGGQTDDLVFGGPIAGVLEELKAETGALHLTAVLRERGEVDPGFAEQVYANWLVWAFGHVAGGMVDGAGQRMTYGQTAAIQLGFLLDQGALRWDPAAPSADGRERGAFSVDAARLEPAFAELLRVVAGIKARGDREAAERLLARYVDGDVVPSAVLAERMLRWPEGSLVYTIVR